MKHSRHVVEPNGPALAELIERLKSRSAGAGRPSTRVIITHEAGRDGFWLARFLERHGVEVHVMHSSSLLVDRRALQAKTDVIDVEMLLRTLMAWLRGEPRVCSMVPVRRGGVPEASRTRGFDCRPPFALEQDRRDIGDIGDREPSRSAE
jgi:transposase